MPSEAYIRISPAELLANLALAQNLVHTRDILGPLWSLPWEVQMYLAIPAVFLVIRNTRWNGIAWTMWTVAVLLRCAGLAGHIRILSLLAYTPCFLVGAIVWRTSRDAQPRWSGILWPPAILAAAIIYMVLGQILPHEPGFLGSYAACIFLGITLPYFRDLPASRLTAAAHYVAKYSYGIYLSHVPLMWITHVPLAHAPGIVRWGFLAASSVMVPVLLFHLVEDPLIRVGKRVASRLFERKQKAAHATA
jgi:peptidoglycan/LPS O-acetylase OafA/YrhL